MKYIICFIVCLFVLASGAPAPGDTEFARLQAHHPGHITGHKTYYDLSGGEPLFAPFGPLLQGENMRPNAVLRTMSAENSTHLSALFKKSLEDKQSLNDMFNEFKAKFHKTYADKSVDGERERIFARNMWRVFEHNVEAMNGKSSYTQHINRFADMTEEEIIDQFGFRLTPEARDRMNRTVSGGHEKRWKGMKGKDVRHVKPIRDVNDDSWVYDWRSVGVVGPVQDQGGCGSCTLFAAAGLVETYWARLGHGVQPLSPQQMIDCYPDPDHNVCDSGAAFQPIYDYVRDKGLTSWDEYPYQAKKNWCDRDREGRTVARINGWNWVAGGGDEGALHLAVQDHGPSAIAIHASDSWASYRQGIYDGPCDGDTNHAVLVVGYGYDKAWDQNFWIVKNSWGEGYGDKGYVYMRKDAGNRCKVADECVQVS